MRRPRKNEISGTIFLCIVIHELYLSFGLGTIESHVTPHQVTSSKGRQQRQLSSKHTSTHDLSQLKEDTLINVTNEGTV